MFICTTLSSSSEGPEGTIWIWFTGESFKFETIVIFGIFVSLKSRDFIWSLVEGGSSVITIFGWEWVCVWVGCLGLISSNITLGIVSSSSSD